MKTLIILLFFCNTAYAGKYNSETIFIFSSGFHNVHEYSVTGTLQGVTTFHLHDAMATPDVKHDWMREMVEINALFWERVTQELLNYKDMLKSETGHFSRNINKTEGHIIQLIVGCEWDDETNMFEGYASYGYNGEDFITFDLKKGTWIAFNARAETITQEWDGNNVRNGRWKNLLTNMYPEGLKIFVNYANIHMNRKDLPSVFLLQKTPSSPVSCHATGFYPDKVMMFWSKDGEEIHEGVNHGNILPNHDESFQMSVDLDVSSIPSEEWMSYKCVFQLSGVQNAFITKLDKDVVQSNYRKPKEEKSERSITNAAVVSVLIIIIIITVLGFLAYRKRSGRSPLPVPTSDPVETQRRLFNRSDH